MQLHCGHGQQDRAVEEQDAGLHVHAAEEGVAARVLENMNVELAKVRTAVEFIIGRGDRPVVGANFLRIRLALLRVGEVAQLGIWRGGSKMTVHAAIAARTVGLVAARV